MPVGPWFSEHTDFDDANEEHIARHRVRPDEVLSVQESEPLWRPNKKSGTGEWQMIGWTSAGRALIVVVQWDEVRRSIRPITARDCTEAEVARWLKGRKR